MGGLVGRKGYLDFLEKQEEVFHLVILRGAVLQRLIHGPTRELSAGVQPTKRARKEEERKKK